MPREAVFEKLSFETHFRKLPHVMSYGPRQSKSVRAVQVGAAGSQPLHCTGSGLLPIQKGCAWDVQTGVGSGTLFCHMNAGARAEVGQGYGPDGWGTGTGCRARMHQQQAAGSLPVNMRARRPCGFLKGRGDFVTHMGGGHFAQHCIYICPPYCISGKESDNDHHSHHARLSDNNIQFTHRQPDHIK